MSAPASAPTAVPTPVGGLDPGVLELPFFTGEHRAAASRTAAWCVRHAHLWAQPGSETPQERGRRILAQLGADGLLVFPHGGDGRPAADMRSVCLTREALAYADDLADFAYSIQALSAAPIAAHGTSAQQRRYLPGMAAGTVQGAFAVSEKAAGSDVAAVTVTARAEDGGYVIDGSKAWIANGDTADVYCVIARTGEGPGALGLTAFCVPAGTPGLRAEPVPVIAPRAFAHLHFTGCRVRADAVLGRPGGGFAIAMEVLEQFRMTVGAAALGFARRATDTALAHARHREIYGGRLLDLATVKATFADIEVKLNAAALLVARAAWEHDRGSRRFGKHSSIAKLHATEAAQEVVDGCVQVLGAAGLVSGSVTERLYRQVRSLRVYEGASEVQRAIIAGSLDLRRAEAAAREASGTAPAGPEETTSHHASTRSPSA